MYLVDTGWECSKFGKRRGRFSGQCKTEIWLKFFIAGHLKYIYLDALNDILKYILRTSSDVGNNCGMCGIWLHWFQTMRLALPSLCCPLLILFTNLPIFSTLDPERVTPVGPHTCDGFIDADSTWVVSEKRPMKQKTTQSCWSISKWFKCTTDRTVWVTSIGRERGASLPATICCVGYKQEGDKCVFDPEYHATRRSRIIIISLLAFIPVGLLFAIIVPTFLYVREKRRRIHLEDLEHDPGAFSSNLRYNALLYRPNHYTTTVQPQSAQTNQDSTYESVDENYMSLPHPESSSPVQHANRSPEYKATCSEDELVKNGVRFQESTYDCLESDTGVELCYDKKLTGNSNVHPTKKPTYKCPVTRYHEVKLAQTSGQDSNYSSTQEQSSES